MGAGQFQTQKECSSAAMLSQCRTLARTTTAYSEVETESIGSDDGSAETKRKVTYARDTLGNVTGITADDAFGHHRSSAITYEPEGVSPSSRINAAEHISLTEFDARFSALIKQTDPNGLATERRYDGFGRFGLEKRPDGSQTSIALSCTQDGGPDKKTWRLASVSRSRHGGASGHPTALNAAGRLRRAQRPGRAALGARERRHARGTAPF